MMKSIVSFAWAFVTLTNLSNGVDAFALPQSKAAGVAALVSASSSSTGLSAMNNHEIIGTGSYYDRDYYHYDDDDLNDYSNYYGRNWIGNRYNSDYYGNNGYWGSRYGIGSRYGYGSRYGMGYNRYGYGGSGMYGYGRRGYGYGYGGYGGRGAYEEIIQGDYMTTSMIVPNDASSVRLTLSNDSGYEINARVQIQQNGRVIQDFGVYSENGRLDPWSGTLDVSRGRNFYSYGSNCEIVIRNQMPRGYALRATLDPMYGGGYGGYGGGYGGYGGGLAWPRGRRGNYYSGYGGYGNSYYGGYGGRGGALTRYNGGYGGYGTNRNYWDQQERRRRVGYASYDLE